jgi:hypothetical protein
MKQINKSFFVFSKIILKFATQDQNNEEYVDVSIYGIAVCGYCLYRLAHMDAPALASPLEVDHHCRRHPLFRDVVPELRTEIRHVAPAFLVLDLGRLCHLVPKTMLYQNGYTSLGIFILIFGIFLYGNLHYHNKVRVPLELKSSKPLPRNYKVVMASDLHLGYHNPRKELARWVDMINAEHPDFILIAGDIIDGSMRPLMEEYMAEEFHRLQAPVYACIGNHEYYTGEPQARQFYKDAGIRLLMDETAMIDSSIVIIGRDDRTNMRRKPVGDLVTDHSKYTIILDHQPYHLNRSEAAGADFQLSGHTHRGQVWPISWITDHIYECSWGKYQSGNTQYYISSGLGIWGGKFRIGTQSEYVVATITQQ